jgi:hypothetical protein
MGVILGMHYTVLSSMCDNRKKLKPKNHLSKKLRKEKSFTPNKSYVNLWFKMSLGSIY